jgi:hypothetical protein
VRRVADVAGATLVLARSRSGWRANELRTADGEVVGTLAVRGLVRWRGFASDAHGDWEFRESGFGVRIRHAGRDADVGRLRRGPRDLGGTIELGPRRFGWQPTSVERRAWSLTEDAVEIAYFRRRAVAPVERLGVGVPTTAARIADLGVLVLFGCYLAVRTPILQRDWRWVGDETPLLTE